MLQDSWIDSESEVHVGSREDMLANVDGWVALIHLQFDFNGMTFEPQYNEYGRLVAYTCTMYRKDWKYPIRVTEYLAECWRDTEAWKKQPHRMLRDVSMVQAARYAFAMDPSPLG